MELFGYIKANKLTSEYIQRQDMENRKEAQIISKNEYTEETIIIENEKINIKNIIYSENNNTNKDKTWGVVKNTFLEDQINIILEDSKTRTELIDSIVNKTISSEVNGLIIDFNKVNDDFKIKRFIIEIVPKLKEIGIKTCIVLNENMKKNDIINIVDYIVE